MGGRLAWGWREDDTGEDEAGPFWVDKVLVRLGSAEAKIVSNNVPVVPAFVDGEAGVEFSIAEANKVSIVTGAAGADG
jgi:hypothetical protein